MSAEIPVDETHETTGEALNGAAQPTVNDAVSITEHAPKHTEEIDFDSVLSRLNELVEQMGTHVQTLTNGHADVTEMAAPVDESPVKEPWYARKIG